MKIKDKLICLFRDIKYVGFFRKPQSDTVIKPSIDPNLLIKLYDQSLFLYSGSDVSIPDLLREIRYKDPNYEYVSMTRVIKAYKKQTGKKDDPLMSLFLDVQKTLSNYHRSMIAYDTRMKNTGEDINDRINSLQKVNDLYRNTISEILREYKS